MFAFLRQNLSGITGSPRLQLLPFLMDAASRVTMKKCSCESRSASPVVLRVLGPWTINTTTITATKSVKELGLQETGLPCSRGLIFAVSSGLFGYLGT